MTRLARVVVLFPLLCPAPAFAQADAGAAGKSVPLAFVSLQRAFYESASGKAAQAALSALQEQTDKEIGTRSRALQGLQTALEQNGGLLAEAARRSREQEIERFQVDLKRFVEDAQAEFLGVQRQMENAFLVKLRPAIDAVARERGLLLVLNGDTGALAWGNPAIDITGELVKLVDAP